MPKGRKSKLSDVNFKVTCEWDDCERDFDDLNSLKEHQLKHFVDLCQSVVSPPSPAPTCGICHLSLDPTDVDGMERHSHYHAWAVYLRERGRQIQKLNNWPSCILDSSGINSVPELPTRFECGWKYCDFTTNDVSVFISHVVVHPEEYSDSRYPLGSELKCLWEDCSYVAPRLKNLTCHLDSHIQRKRIACPTCGLLLVSLYKLENHLKRQQIHLVDENTTDMSSFHSLRCDRCRRIFATEQLLVDHMRRHINTIKCPYCDMTVFSKSVLERHVLFRHTENKPFACEFCDYRCKLSDMLRRHIRLKHQSSDQNAGKHLDSEIASSSELMGIKYSIQDADLDAEPPQKFGRIPGPLAAAGSCPRSSVLVANAHPPGDSFDLVHGNSQPSKFWIHCTRPGCNFQTTKFIGYLVHYGRKHAALPVEGNKYLEADGQSSNIRILRGPVYACHLCSVTKRRGSELSKHLMRDHQLARPSGHVRFTYTMSADGLYRLQLTRLDTIPVASAVLGEDVVSHMLSDTHNPLSLRG
ncbi:unnamed protein product [Calicophoron daubneyi]|uniref:C2H2-type domain-containing protein n=1 Tax=Calicophoron daubneyi TaxID=300641 RepID=A0AAV2SWK3_CALDB